MIDTSRAFASFRDPSGFIFYKNEVLYRQINQSYARQYQNAKDCGLFDLAINNGWMLPFEEIHDSPTLSPEGYKVIKPRFVPFVSYPYEWCFSQIKDAALLTLDLHLAAIEHDMLLKDASIYNIQFIDGRPTFIDHLSFDNIEGHGAWPAYGQFCRHFLAPLLLMAFCDHRMSLMLRDFIDGIPLDLASRLLPKRTYMRMGTLMHLHMHAKSQVRYSDKVVDMKKRAADRRSLFAMASSLRRTIEKTEFKVADTEWAKYYEDTNYNDQAMDSKKSVVGDMLQKASPQMVWDLGGNIGVFSRISAANNLNTICFDVDHSAVEQNYRQCRQDRANNILPLVMDLTNPSPGLGFAGRERDSLQDRGPVDMIMALALIHHLAISNNLPLSYIAEYFAGLAEWLIIEFVPKQDSQVQRLLATREDIFPDYDEAGFENAFSKHFDIIDKQAVNHSNRCIYLMKSKLS